LLIIGIRKTYDIGFLFIFKKLILDTLGWDIFLDNKEDKYQENIDKYVKILDNDINTEKLIEKLRGKVNNDCK
jgi:hypothetical protein